MPATVAAPRSPRITMDACGRSSSPRRPTRRACTSIISTSSAPRSATRCARTSRRARSRPASTIRCRSTVSRRGSPRTVRPPRSHARSRRRTRCCRCPSMPTSRTSRSSGSRTPPRGSLRGDEGMSGAPALSIVVPVYDEEDNVAPLFTELTRVATDLRKSYEIIFVNDGSRDATLARLDALRVADPHLRIVDLDGNFGEAAALSAGFAHARGELVVTLDGDGQNDPADIPRLLARLDPSVDVVSGRRRERKEAFLTRVLPSRIANWLIARATGVPVYDCGCGLKVYRREVLADAQLPRGMNRFLPAVLGVRPGRVEEVIVG